MTDCSNILRLLQLASPALPVGAYSYSEGLEYLVHNGTITHQQDLEHWLTQELTYGAVRLEAAMVVRAYQATTAVDFEALMTWNQWLSAARETEELRSQSHQMGRSLLRLTQSIDARPAVFSAAQLKGLEREGVNFAIAFGYTAAHWHIDCDLALLGYLQSWATNLINAGIKLIPLGQTTGQQLLFQLQPQLETATLAILNLQDDDLYSCGWGLSLASMAHETQYSRLFRS